MKKKAFRAFGRVVVCALISLPCSFVYAQVAHPSTWAEFVSGTANPVVADTFRLQTFATSVSDNWAYASKGNVVVVETSRMEISGKCGKYGLSIPMESEVSFQYYDIDQYDSVLIGIHVGAQNRKKGDSLMVRTYRPGDPEYIKLVGCDVDNERKTYGNSVRVMRNPRRIDLVTFKPTTYSADSRYCLDSIYALGQIPAYSLFSGAGNWSDTIRWTHLPAARVRNALVNGAVWVDSHICCADLFVGNGTIRILPQGNLTVNNLSFHSDDHPLDADMSSPLVSAGTVDVRGAVMVEKVFSRKGAWHFISLPFDVYPDGIDRGFLLGDDQGNTNGNYFYVKAYNGEKRAERQSASGNWETVSRSALASGKPLLQKGKGYLVALDEAADRASIRFTSRSRPVAADFGKNGASSISVTINGLSHTQDHNGWYLCGNPLPSALPLNQVVSNPALDGFVYLYDGSIYQSYAIGSDYAIPPFSAFFVKATGDTELSIRNIRFTSPSRALDAIPPLSPGLPEPEGLSTLVLPSESALVSCRVTGDLLRLEDLDSSGDLRIFNQLGTLVFRSPVSSGCSTIRLPLPAGIYILRLETRKERIRQKFILS